MITLKTTLDQLNHELNILNQGLKIKINVIINETIKFWSDDRISDKIFILKEKIMSSSEDYKTWVPDPSTDLYTDITELFKLQM